MNKLQLIFLIAGNETLISELVLPGPVLVFQSNRFFLRIDENKFWKL